MKNISPIWFIKEPIDQEHKEYILLDYLKELSKNLNSENCYSTLREVSRLLRILTNFKSKNSVELKSFNGWKPEDRDIIVNFKFNALDESTREKILNIVDSSLETLYEYSEICMDILKDEESKIKIFEVETEIEKNLNKKSNSGILIIRNMINDKIIPYHWQGSLTMKTDEGDKEICILKRIYLKNSKFSLNYEYIYHEILAESNLEKKSSPSLYVIQIYENFEENSEIYRLAKEKFIEKIS
jgi:hypothetical protein